MTLFDTSQFQTCLSGDFLVKIYPWLETEWDSLEVAQVCFLKDSDFFKPSNLVALSSKTWRVCSQLTGEPISNPYSSALMKWGTWGRGKCVTGIAGCHRIEAGRLSLQDCLIDGGDKILDRHRAEDRIYTEYSPTLRTCGSGGHPFQVLKNGIPRPLQAIEAERLMGWPENSTEKGIDKQGNEITISRTQRINVLGNGVIPQEIEHLANSLKEVLCK